MYGVSHPVGQVGVAALLFPSAPRCAGEATGPPLDTGAG